jgi:hypothetical protein
MIEAIVCTIEMPSIPGLTLSLNTTTDWSQKVGKMRGESQSLGNGFHRNLGPSQYRIFEAVRISDYIVERERERMMPVFESSGFSSLLHSYSLCWSSP